MSGKGSRPRPYSVSQETFNNNWDTIFKRNNNMNPSNDPKQPGTCGCGRSPTGNCVGWHALTEEKFKERKELYETGKVDLQGREVK